MKLYNSLTRRKEKFIPLQDNKVHFYSCGQTIYLDLHLGNARTYSYWDVLVDISDGVVLMFFGFKT